MNDFDTAIASADDALFEAFGTDTTVQRGVDAAVPVRVVLTRGVARLGEYGQVVATVTTADFRNSEWQPRRDDVLLLSSGDRAIESITSDDGAVTQAVLYG